MKKIAAFVVLAAIVPACGPETVDRAGSARQGFEEWVRVAVAGDAIKVFHGMSDAFKSAWLYDRFEESDGTIRRWRAELTGQSRTDLDLWLGVARKRSNGREEQVPPSVLADPSLALAFKELFMRTYDGVRVQMSRLAVSEVYSDDSGVTVAVMNGLGSTELYGMIYERDGWKVDAHRQPLTPGR